MHWLRWALSLPMIAVLVMLLALGLVRTGTITPIGAFGTVIIAWIVGGVGSTLVGALKLWRGRHSHVAPFAIWQLGTGLLLIAVLLLQMRSAAAPPIHDISTDRLDPPMFHANPRQSEPPERDLTYPQGGRDVPRQQADAYPDLVPIHLPATPQQTRARVLAAIEVLGWTVTWSSPSGDSIEAVDVTPLFRFVDDIVVRIRPGAGGSIVDVRSVSRVGRSDLGANAARIRALRERLQTGGPS